MSALTTRQDARERMRRVFEGALDQMIPPDESIPLKGSRFTDFEDQVEALGRQVLPVALGEDWARTLDGKQIQRWSEAIGRTMVQQREAEVQAFEQGHRPASPANAPTLLVIGLDGGRVQMREKTGKNDSRWREDKIGTITTYLPWGRYKERPTKTVGDDVCGDDAEHRGLWQDGARGGGASRTVTFQNDSGHWRWRQLDRSAD